MEDKSLGEGKKKEKAAPLERAFCLQDSHLLVDDLGCGRGCEGRSLPFLLERR